MPPIKMRLKALLPGLLIAVFFVCSAKAQTYSTHGFGVAINYGYDAPLGNQSYTFKPGATYGISVLSYSKNWITSISFGYLSYKPKQDLFYYQVDDSNYGTIKYQNFTAYQLYLGVAYSLELSTELKAYGGVNFGEYLTHTVYLATDAYAGADADLHENNVYLAPKLGIKYSINDNISIGAEGKYNIFAISGNAAYNSNVGTVYSSYTGNLVLTYNF